MTTQQVVQFEYQQSLAWESDRPRWSERLQASVRLTDAALTSGWLREHFSGRRGGAVDFLVLAAIVMHARPLRGEDLDYLIRLEMADPQDEGRLFARVTDLGLADELGVHRTTIAASAERLARYGFIEIAKVPESVHYQDSKGRFAGTRAYLLAGDIQQRFLKKDLQPAPADPTLAETATVVHVGLSDTVATGSMSVGATEPVSPADTNKIPGGEGEDFFQKIWRRFGELKGDPGYQPKPREVHLLESLLQEEYTADQILSGIESAFQPLSDGAAVHHFGYCLPLIRAAAPGANPCLLADPAPAVGSADLPANANDKSSEPIQVPAHVIAIFTQANHERPPTHLELRRLGWLHDECRPVVEAQDADAWDWIIAALKDSAGQANNLVAYTAKIVRNRLAQIDQETSLPQTASRKRKSKAAQVKPPNDPASSQPSALTFSKTQIPTKGYIIPAEYSRAALQRAMEQIPDDQ